MVQAIIALPDHFASYHFHFMWTPIRSDIIIIIIYNIYMVHFLIKITRLLAASDKVYQLLVHGRWFSPGTPASSTTKTGRHDIAEILLKVALNSINQIKSNLIKITLEGHHCSHDKRNIFVVSCWRDGLLVFINHLFDFIFQVLLES